MANWISSNQPTRILFRCRFVSSHVIAWLPVGRSKSDQQPAGRGAPPPSRQCRNERRACTTASSSRTRAGELRSAAGSLQLSYAYGCTRPSEPSSRRLGQDRGDGDATRIRLQDRAAGRIEGSTGADERGGRLGRVEAQASRSSPASPGARSPRKKRVGPARVGCRAARAAPRLQRSPIRRGATGR
jgi:hypothetical protein